MGVGVDWTGPWAPDIELFDAVGGRDILELGCGGGQCTVALAQQGASVTGIDLSREQLRHASSLADEHDVEIRLLEGDVTDLGMFDDEEFEVAFNACVFQWVEDLDSCFGETFRVLEPGGRFVFALSHPFFDVIDSDTLAVEESYFDLGEHVVEHEDMDVDQVTYRHPIHEVHSALVDAGFHVQQIREPGSSDPDDYGHGPWGEHTPEAMATVPSTLLFDATKPAQ